MNKEEFFEETALLMYSHSDYSDVWPLFFGQAEKYLSKFTKKYLFVDSEVEQPGWTTILYDDALSYNERFASCLSHVDEKYCIHHHEDMPLYDNPDIDTISKLPACMEKNSLDYVKFLAINLHVGQRVDKELNVYKILNSEYLMAVQPSIWNTKKLLHIYENTKIKNIQDFEIYASHIAKVSNITGSYIFNGEPLRGEFHHDSSVYPYVCTAVVKGKWDLKTYKLELGKLLEEYSIDPKQRGSHD